MTEELIRNYTEILKDELVPAMGCTEPIAIAYAAAKAVQVLGAEPDRISVACSGNIIKNVKGVTVPNSGGQKGIETAAVLGAVGGDADRVLEVIADADDAARERTRKMVAEGCCTVSLAENVPNLYIRTEVSGGGHTAAVVIEEHHTSITRIEKDGEVLFTGTPEEEQEEARKFNEDGADGNTVKAGGDETRRGDLKKMTLRSIIEYANSVDVKEVEELLERQIRFNTAISQEGLDNRWGARDRKSVV